MAGVVFVICVAIILNCSFSTARLLVVPEDVAMLFTTIYGFAPPIHKGNDHRIGFGYRFGEHADFQVLYEFGPQTTTKELTQPIDVRSDGLTRRNRRPFVDFLLRSGLVKDASNNLNDNTK